MLVSIMNTDPLVIKHQGISMHVADSMLFAHTIFIRSGHSQANKLVHDSIWKDNLLFEGYLIEAEWRMYVSVN